jgi:hypothetical protein
MTIVLKEISFRFYAYLLMVYLRSPFYQRFIIYNDIRLTNSINSLGITRKLTLLFNKENLWKLSKSKLLKTYGNPIPVDC